MTQAEIFPGRFEQEYEDLGTLGSGGFGVVLKARHLTDNTEYAVKQILIEEGENLEEVLREVRSHSKLRHQNIVAYNTSWLEEAEEKQQFAWNEDDELSESSDDSETETDGPGRYLYIVMELGNETLHKWLKEHPNKEDRVWKQTRNWIKQLVNGLSYIHKKGKIHRDLKPENILMFHGRFTVVKITDFGLVKAVLDKDGKSIVKHTGSIGTDDYMAPEQDIKEYTSIGDSLAKYDERVDIYALGMISTEMIYPMDVEEKMSLISTRWRGQKPETLEEKVDDAALTKKVKGILLGMTEKDPEKRMKLSDVLLKLRPEKEEAPDWVSNYSTDDETENSQAS